MGSRGCERSRLPTVEVLWGFAFTPINALPGLGGVPVSEIPSQMTNGTRCPPSARGVGKRKQEASSIGTCHAKRNDGEA